MLPPLEPPPSTTWKDAPMTSIRTGRTALHRTTLLVTVGLLGLLGLAVVQLTRAPAASARSAFSGPFMGWSTWSNESSTRSGYGKDWLTEQNVKNAADAVASKLKSAGY